MPITEIQYPIPQHPSLPFPTFLSLKCLTYVYDTSIETNTAIHVLPPQKKIGIKINCQYFIQRQTETFIHYDMADESTNFNLEKGKEFLISLSHITYKFHRSISTLNTTTHYEIGKENANKWRAISRWWTGRANVEKMSNSKLIYQLWVISLKIPAGFPLEIDKGF